MTEPGDAAERELQRAIDACVIANHGLAARLGPDRPPHTATTPEGLRHYGPGERFDLWCAWRAIERLRHAAARRQATTAPATAQQGTTS